MCHVIGFDFRICLEWFNFKQWGSEREKSDWIYDKLADIYRRLTSFMPSDLWFVSVRWGEHWITKIKAQHRYAVMDTLHTKAATWIVVALCRLSLLHFPFDFMCEMRMCVCLCVLIFFGSIRKFETNYPFRNCPCDANRVSHSYNFSCLSNTFYKCCCYFFFSFNLLHYISFKSSDVLPNGNRGCVKRSKINQLTTKKKKQDSTTAPFRFIITMPLIMN